VVSGAGERPAKATSPALSLHFPISTVVENLRPPCLRVLNKKAHPALAAVPEIAHVRCQAPGL